jgi:hypothetical protein
LEKVNGIAEDLTWVFRDTLINKRNKAFLTSLFMQACCYIHLHRRTGHRNCFSWRIYHGKVVFVSSLKTLYTHFEDICEILKQYDVLFSWRRLTSRSIADANDAAQFAELETGTIKNRLQARCPSFHEGPGHVPMHMIKKTWKNNWNIVTKHHFTTRSINYRYRSGLWPHYLCYWAAMIGW